MAKKSKKSTPAKTAATAPKPAKSAAKPAPKAPRRWRLFLAIFTSLLFLVLLAGASVTYAIVQMPENGFVAKFTAGPLALNAGTFEEAETSIDSAAQKFLTTAITFTSERGSLTTTLAAAGVTIDTTTAKTALATFASSATLPQKISTYFFGQSLALPLTVDPVALKTAFVLTPIEQGLKNAEFTLQGTTVAIALEQGGYGIDTTTLADKIQSAWNLAETPETMQLPLLTSTPAVTSSQLEPLLAHAQTATTTVFTLTDEFGKTYTIALSDHIDWLIPGSGKVFGFQQEKFAASVATDLAPGLEQEPQNATITQNEEGAYSFEGSARFGQKIDTLALQDSLESALETILNPTPAPAAPAADAAAIPAATAIAIPVTRILPHVSVPESLTALGVTDLVGMGYSDFAGSPTGRIHNINTGISQFNGVLIAKDAEFSFMDQLSPVDAANGFVPELVIKGDKTIPEYGGGMCQVSSTMFRAALYSGLSITARTNHSYAVSYYAKPFGYGLDATVYDPTPDFKFVNDTPASLLVQSYTEGSTAYYVFYGTSDGRKVTMTGPTSYGYNSTPEVTTFVDTLAHGERKLKEHGHTGFKTDWIRTITRTDGTSMEETIHSDYEARPEKWDEGI